MPLSKQQIESLLTMVVSSTPDTITCDGCMDNVAEFAESELLGLSLDESQEKVKNHLQNCPCCSDEYNAFLLALNAAHE